jgi:beta-lactamase class A
MVIMSDNTAYNNLMTLVGEGDGVAGVHFVNDMLAEMGIQDTRLHHGLIPGEGYFTDGGDNVSTPYDIGVIFEQLYFGQVISPEASSEMIEWLKLCGDTMELAAGLPEGVEFAHKTGCADDIYHDGGVVYMGDRDYIISLFTAGFGDDRSEMMAEISRYVYEYEANLF